MAITERYECGGCSAVYSSRERAERCEADCEAWDYLRAACRLAQEQGREKELLAGAKELEARFLTVATGA